MKDSAGATHSEAATANIILPGKVIIKVRRTDEIDALIWVTLGLKRHENDLPGGGSQLLAGCLDLVMETSLGKWFPTSFSCRHIMDHITVVQPKHRRCRRSLGTVRRRRYSSSSSKPGQRLI